MWSRRELLKAAAAGFSVLIVPPSLQPGGRARAAGTDRVLVVVFLRGAADFLNLVVPAGDPNYYTLRPTVGVTAGTELPLDGFFGLHPSLSALRPWYLSGQLAVIHACGSPTATRSHFDEQDFMEHAAPGDKTVVTGWLNRYLLAAGISNPTGAITLGNRAVQALAGDATTLAIPSIASMDLAGSFPTERRATLDQIYRSAGGPLAQTAENAFQVYDTLKSVNTATSVTYPTGQLGPALRDVAALVKANIGVRVVAADLGGWDHHVEEPSRIGGLASGLAAALNAFATDLGSDLGRTTILVMTEFGRRARENPSRGTDHGYASAMIALGGGVAGGQVLLRNDVWPGLAAAQMFQGVDLAVTTDYRDVFAEVLTRHMGLSNLNGVFPSFTPSATRFPGLYV